MKKEIILRKITQYEDGIEDMWGCPYYYINTEVYCEKDAEYFKKRGWSRIIKSETFGGMIKRWLTKIVF